MADEELLAGEVDTSQKDSDELDQVHKVTGDVYTFVRSREINKAISSFTLDHYIDERKRRIKGERILRSASNPGDGVGRRPSQLDAITKLEEDFKNTFEKMSTLAQAAEADKKS